LLIAGVHTNPLTISTATQENLESNNIVIAILNARLKQTMLFLEILVISPTNMLISHTYVFQITVNIIKCRMFIINT